MVYRVELKKVVYVDVDDRSEIEDAVFDGVTFNESEEIESYCRVEED